MDAVFYRNKPLTCTNTHQRLDNVEIRPTSHNHNNNNQHKNHRKLGSYTTNNHRSTCTLIKINLKFWHMNDLVVAADFLAPLLVVILTYIPCYRIYSHSQQKKKKEQFVYTIMRNKSQILAKKTTTTTTHILATDHGMWMNWTTQVKRVKSRVRTKGEDGECRRKKKL